MEGVRHKSSILIWFIFFIVGTFAKYAIVVPKEMRCGENNTITVSVFDAKSDVNIHVDVKSRDAAIATVRDAITSGQTNEVSFFIPMEECGTNSLVVQVRGDGGLEFNKETRDIKLVNKNMSIYVQTDKATYKPGQKVLCRAFAVYSNLKPYMGKMNITIVDPKGNTIKQWLEEELSSVRPFVSHELQLSDHPVTGDWKVHVDAGKETKDKIFVVAKYVLPKFKVEVEMPTYHVLGSGDIEGRILAKYTYGKPVIGKVSIAIKPISYTSGPSLTIISELIDGIAHFTISRDKFGTGGIASNSAIFIQANVTEELSEITHSGESSIQIKNSKYVLEFMDLSPNNYKLKMAYVGYIQIKQVNGQPPDLNDFKKDNGSEIPLRLQYDQQYKVQAHKCANLVTKKATISEDYTIPENGLVKFVSEPWKQIPEGAKPSDLSINARISSKFSSHELHVSKTVRKFNSNSGHTIQVSHVQASDVRKTGQPINFILNTTTPIESFTYQIISKGAIITSKTTSVIIAESYSFSVVLDGEMSQKIAPSARIIVWCISSDGELLIDSLNFKIEVIFPNNINVKFNVKEARPADNVTLSLSAHPDSLVGILVADESTLFLKGGNDISRVLVTDDLTKFHKSALAKGQDTKGLLEGAQVTILTDAIIFSATPDTGKGQLPEGCPQPTQRSPIVDDDFMQWFEEYLLNDDNFNLASLSGSLGGHARQIHYLPFSSFRRYSLGHHLKSFSPERRIETTDEQAQGIKSSGSLLHEVDRVRPNFPETWLWTDVIVGNNGSVDIRATVPDTITSWTASAFALSPADGLGIAANIAKLIVFKPFFLSLNLPYSVIRGEEFALSIGVFNYLPEELEIRITLKTSKHYLLRDEDDLKTTSDTSDFQKWITVPAGQGSTTTVWVKPLALGSIPIEVKAQSNVAADAVRRMLLVDPEGVSQEYSQSVYIRLRRGNEAYVEKLAITYPRNVVKGSEHIKIISTGDLMGPSITGLDNLLKMPFGCGEQNMIKMAPNIFVAQYLSAIGKLSPPIEKKVKSFMERGYQEELRYQHEDGSFSIFGQGDPFGSVWLTAFVLKSFQQARQFIFIDNKIILRAANWIMDHQEESGSFREPANENIFDRQMRGGSSRNNSLTSYVLIALLEARDAAGDESVFKSRLEKATERSTNCLLNNLPSIQGDAFALAIASYALALAGNKTNDTMTELNKLAKKTAGMKYWTRDGTNKLSSEKSQQASAEDIELNSYALLASIVNEDLSGAARIMKWLVSQRNSHGGFASTQDTVMALQALSTFSAVVSPRKATNINLTVYTSSSAHEFEPINHRNYGLTQTVECNQPIEYVNVEAKGHGVALVQLSVIYNIIEVDNSPEVILSVKSWVEDQNTYGVHVCTSSNSTWKDENFGGMALVNLEALTGTHWDDNSDIILSQLDGHGRLVENNGHTLSVYMDKFTSEKSCFKIIAHRDVVINNQQAAKVEAYPYYHPNRRSVHLYLPEDIKNV